LSFVHWALCIGHWALGVCALSFEHWALGVTLALFRNVPGRLYAHHRKEGAARARRCAQSACSCLCSQFPSHFYRISFFTCPKFLHTCPNSDIFPCARVRFTSTCPIHLHVSDSPPRVRFLSHTSNFLQFGWASSNFALILAIKADTYALALLLSLHYYRCDHNPKA
jgi:hypothetical protein